MMTTANVIFNVAISRNAVERWKEMCYDFVKLRSDVLRLEDIHDEQAIVEFDGSLTIFTATKDVMISMSINPEEWEWRPTFLN